MNKTALKTVPDSGNRELIRDYIGRPIIVRFIPAIPMRRIDLRQDARPEFLMTKRARLLLADTTVKIIVCNRRCDRR